MATRRCRPHKRESAPWEHPPGVVNSDDSRRHFLWRALSASGLGGGDEVEDADTVDVGVAVVELDRDAAGWLLDVEVQQVAVASDDGAVGVRDRDRLCPVDSLGAEVDGVDLAATAG